MPPTLSSAAQLTSLAQLGTLRLGCDRAFISLIDCDTQYIIAEATRTISLHQSHQFESPQDALYLGVQALHKSFGVCPNTMSVFTDTRGIHSVHSQHVTADTTKYIICDFRELEAFKDRPYVVGFPHMRSYAEVPLKGPSGHVVGSFCVVDTKPRHDFDLGAVSVLNEISKTIMEYLELVTVRHNHDRGERLMEGLRLFTEGKSDFPAICQTMPASQKAALEQIPAPSSTVDDDLHTPLSEENVTPNGSASDVWSSGSTDPLSSASSTSPTNLSSQAISPSASVTTPSDARVSDPFDKPTKDDSDLSNLIKNDDDDDVAIPQGSGVSAEVGAAFSRAARLIRESMEMESLVLFDACLNGFRSWVSNGRDEHDIDDEDAVDEQDRLGSDGAHVGSTYCPVLGSSQCAGTSRSSAALPEALLKRLLKSYPRGHVFSADEYGPIPNVASSDATFVENTDNSGVTPKQKSVHSELIALFPFHRSLIWLPLWDFQKERWFAGVLGGTADPTRIFEREDLTCLSAFGNSLMVEMARLEALEISRAKSDFISSVSHELRSPLHGILASAELLRESLGDDPEQLSLVSMIESCGTTLLDTMNHLLDFAKINSLDNGQRRKSSMAPDQEPGSTAMTSVRDLADLVQDVVEGVYVGHTSSNAAHRNLTPEDDVASDIRDSAFNDKSKSPPPTGNGSIAVLIDIEKRSDWQVPLNAGAWKRIVMNLFANSMKYTIQGHIQVSLKRVTQSGPTGDQDYACFVVSDTGIGMNAEYLKHRLFTPFAQENSLAVGTGLGLSIVKQIVNNIGGQIEVQSEVGIGTRIRVLAPLAASPVANGAPSAMQPSRSADEAGMLQGRTLCLVSLDCPTEDDQGRHGDLSVEAKRLYALKPLISQLASDWFGMKVVSAKSLDETPSDCYLAQTALLEGLGSECSDHSGEGFESGQAGAVLALDSAGTELLRHPVVNGRAITQLRYPYVFSTLSD